MSRIGGKDPNVPRPLGNEDLQEAREGGGGQSGQVGEAKPSVPKKVNAIDAERMVSQAGFARSGSKKKNQGLDVGDSSQAPIPLPEDDLEGVEWSMEGLTQAQSQLLQHNAQLGRSRRNQRGEGLLAAFAAMVQARGEGGDADEGHAEDEAAAAAGLASLGEQTPPPATAMAALASSVQAQFGIDFAGAPVGAALMATSLLVAGHPEDVQVQKDAAGTTLVADKLMGGLQRVMDEGRNAAEDARRRSEGVNKNLAMHRTFVPKR